jgi:hypothetical protein
MEQQRQGAPGTVSPGTLGMGRLVLRCHRFTVSTVTLHAGLSLRPHAHPHDQLGGGVLYRLATQRHRPPREPRSDGTDPLP